MAQQNSTPMDVDDPMNQDCIEIDSLGSPASALSNPREDRRSHFRSLREQTPSLQMMEPYISTLAPHSPYYLASRRAMSASSPTVQQGSLSPRQQIESQSRPLFGPEEQEDITGIDGIPHRTRLHQPELGLFNRHPSPPQEEGPPPYSPPRGRNESLYNPYMEGHNDTSRNEQDGIGHRRLCQRHQRAQVVLANRRAQAQNCVPPIFRAFGCEDPISPGISRCRCFGGRNLPEIWNDDARGNEHLFTDGDRSEMLDAVENFAGRHGGSYNQHRDPNPPNRVGDSINQQTGTHTNIQPNVQEQMSHSNSGVTQQDTPATSALGSTRSRWADIFRERSHALSDASQQYIPTASDTEHRRPPWDLIAEMSDSSSTSSQHATLTASTTGLQSPRWDVIIQTPSQNNPYWRVHNPSRCSIRIDNLHSQAYLWGEANTGSSSPDDNNWVSFNNSDFRDPNVHHSHPHGGPGQHDNQASPPTRDEHNDMDTSPDGNDERPQNRSSGIDVSNDCRDTDSGYGASEESNGDMIDDVGLPRFPKLSKSDAKGCMGWELKRNANRSKRINGFQPTTANVKEGPARVINKAPTTTSAIRKRRYMSRRLYILPKKPECAELNRLQLMWERKAAVRGRGRYLADLNVSE